MAVLLGTATAQVTLDIGQFMANAKTATGAMNELAGAGSAGRGPTMFDRLNKSALGIGTALIAPMALAITTAANLEQSLANVDAALGNITDEELNVLSNGFQELAVASQFSATQVAQVGEELAKAGFDQSEIIGATQATIDLAQATGTDLTTSVGAVTQAMNTWQEGIVDSTIALTDASRVADIYTVAANNSSASVSDIAIGMRSLGPIAASMGVSFEDSAAAVALFTNYGLKGADAGISLARGMQNLADPTSEASAAMQTLGITAFDAQGQFVGFSSLFEQLNTSMAGMTDQQKLATLSLIFGAEAMDVMGLAVLTGADAYNELTGEMEASGQAAEASAIRMDTLAAQFGTLKEGIATFLGSLVSGLIPGLRLVVDVANEFVNALMQIPGPIKTVVGAIAGLLAAYAGVTRAIQTFRALNGIMNALGGSSVAAGVASRGLGAVLLRFVPILGLISLGFVAWQANLFDIQGKFRTFISGLRNFGRSFSESFRNLTADIKSFNIWGGENGVLAQGMATLPALFIAFGNALADVGGGVPVLEDIGTKLIAVGDTIVHLTEAFDHFRTLGLDPVQAGLRALGVMFPSISGFVGDLQVVVGTLTESFRSFVAGNFADGLVSLGIAAQTAFAAISNVAGVLLDWTLNVAVPTITGWLVDAAGDVWGALTAAAGFVWIGLVQLGAWTLEVAVPAITGWVADNAGDVWAAISAAAGFVWENLIVPLGTWTLEVAVPVIGGWLASGATGIAGFIRGELGSVAVDLATWTLDVAAPKIAMGGWSLVELILDALREDVVVPLTNVVIRLDGAEIVAGAFDLPGAIVSFITDTPIQTIAIAAGLVTIALVGLPLILIAGLAAAITKAVVETIPESVVIAGTQLGISIVAFTIELAGLLGEIALAVALQVSGYVIGGISVGVEIAKATVTGVAGILGDIAVAVALQVSGYVVGGVSIGIEIANATIDVVADIVADITLAVVGLIGDAIDVGSLALKIADFTFEFPDIDPVQIVQDWLPDSIDWSVFINILPDFLFPDGSPAGDPVNPGLEPEPVPVPDPQTWIAYGDALEYARLRSIGLKGALDGLFAGSGRGAIGAGGGGAGALLGELTAVQTALTTLTTVAQNTALAMSIAGQMAGQAFSTGLTAGMNTAIATVANSLSTIVSVTSSMMASMAAAAASGMASVRASVAAGMNGVIVAVANGMATARAVTAAGAASMAASMVAGMAVFRNAVTSGMAGAVAAVRSGVAAMVAAAAAGRGAMASAGLAMGAALGQGVAAGIQSQIGAVAAAAAALVAAAVGAARSAGQISSPSKLMRDEIGYNLSLGVAEGIYAGLPAIYRAGSAMIPDIPIGQYANSAPYGGMVTHTTVVHAPVVVHGNVTTENAIIEHAAEHISEAIVRESQRRATALGVNR